MLKGLTLRGYLGVIFQDDDFVDLHPDNGQYGLSPWRLALITIMQFREHLADRRSGCFKTFSLKDMLKFGELHTT